ncbi:hypothetical protein BJ742DRAFT_431573 [Cladochytrium replicatum]|nr:hypothetical protein BJ742DRAFT_431573 [Cladochytrium replicatum]
MAAAILVHNIPVGTAIAIPLWPATQGSTNKVLLLRYVLRNKVEDIEIAMSSLLAVVAGVMAAISLDELVHTTIQFSPPRAAD